MLQLVINQNKCIDERNQDETLQLWAIRHQPLGETKVRQGLQNKDPLSNDESTSNASNSFNVETKDVVDDETRYLFLLNGSREVEELIENKLNLFVQNEDLRHIMNLLLEKQVNMVMFGEISDFDDFKDQLRCVNQDEERRNEQFKAAKGKDVLNIF